MKQYFWKIALSAALVLAMSGSAMAADGPGETRTVDAKVTRVYLEGTSSLLLRQGPTATLIVHGDKDDVSTLTINQSGDSIHIENGDGVFLHAPHVHVELTLPNLSQFTSSGIGSAQVSGFSGDNLQINVTGTGSVNVNAHYRQVMIRSTGIGSTRVDDGESDKIEVHSPGAGHVILIGQTKELFSKLDGVGGLDARELKADSVTTYLNGVGNVKVYAKKSANMHLHGVGSVTVYGNPTERSSEINGFGNINWE